MNGRNLSRIIAASSLVVLGSEQIVKPEEPTQQSITETLDYSDEWIEAEIQKLLIMGGEIIPEDEFFSEQARLLAVANDYIVFRGYDSSFMESSVVINTLKLALMHSADIYALLPEGLETILDRLQRELVEERYDFFGEIKIIRTSKPLKRGYILAGNWFFGAWDSEKPPANPDNEYLRALIVNMDSNNLNNLFGRMFLIETGQDSVYSDLSHSQGEPLFPKLEYSK